MRKMESITRYVTSPLEGISNDIPDELPTLHESDGNELSLGWQVCFSGLKQLLLIL
jgi:hypothetical protein